MVMILYTALKHFFHPYLALIIFFMTKCSLHMFYSMINSPSEVSLHLTCIGSKQEELKAHSAARNL